MSFLDNATGLVGVVDGVNTASGGWLVGLLLLTAWILIIMVYINKAETEDLLLGSGFIMSIVTGLFFFIGLVPSWVLIFPVLSIIGGILLKYMG